MDCAELNQRLENFKRACIEQGCVDANKDVFIIQESFPGLKPTSFIVNVIVKNEWLKDKHHRTALKELDELLYKTADDQTLENILTLRIANVCDASFTLDPIKDSILGEISA
jgi:hypothetical protein